MNLEQCNSSNTELQQRKKIAALFRQCPIPENELLRNLGLFINRQTFSRFMFFYELYQKKAPF